MWTYMYMYMCVYIHTLLVVDTHCYMFVCKVHCVSMELISLSYHSRTFLKVRRFAKPVKEPKKVLQKSSAMINSILNLFPFRISFRSLLYLKQSVKHLLQTCVEPKVHAYIYMYIHVHTHTCTWSVTHTLKYVSTCLYA